MNIIDYGIVILIAFSTIFGFFRGFTQSLLSLSARLVTFPLLFWLAPKIAQLVTSNTEIMEVLSNWFSVGKSPSMLALSPISALNLDTLSALLESTKLPEIFRNLLETRFTQQALSTVDQLTTSAGDYINQTVLTLIINALSYFLCFIVFVILIKLLLNFINVLFQLPILKHFDRLLGAVCGFALGCILCLVFVSAVPLLESVFPNDTFFGLVQDSMLAGYFQSNALSTFIYGGQF